MTDRPALAERLRARVPLAPDEALRLTHDVALALVPLHLRGLAHGGVALAAVVVEGTSARLGDPVASPGATRREDLRGLGRVLYAAATGVEPGPGLPEPPDVHEADLPDAVRDVAGWCLHPADDRGAQSVGDVVWILERALRGESCDVAVPPAWGARRVRLDPHRLALRVACQAAGSALLLGGAGLFLGRLRVAPGLAAAGAVLGAGVCLVDELGRGLPDRRGALALGFAATAPVLATLAGAVVARMFDAGDAPIDALAGTLARGWTIGRALSLSILGGVPSLAFALARPFGPWRQTWVPALVSGGVALTGGLCLGGARVGGRDLLGLFFAPALTALVAALLLGLGLSLGQRLERLFRGGPPPA